MSNRYLLVSVELLYCDDIHVVYELFMFFFLVNNKSYDIHMIVSFLYVLPSRMFVVHTISIYIEYIQTVNILSVLKE